VRARRCTRLERSRRGRRLGARGRRRSSRELTVSHRRDTLPKRARMKVNMTTPRFAAAPSESSRGRQRGVIE